MDPARLRAALVSERWELAVNPDAAPPPRMLALGDSYTIGECVAPEDRWPSQLVRELRSNSVSIADPEIIAVTGWTTDDLQRGIDAHEPRGPFDLVTLLIGVNNQYQGRPLEEFREQLGRLVRRAVGFAGGEPGRVVMISVPDWGVTPHGNDRDRGSVARAIDRFNDAARQSAHAAGVRFVDVTDLSRTALDRPELTAADGLHPSSAMYALWVERISPIAREVLVGPPDVQSMNG